MSREESIWQWRLLRGEGEDGYGWGGWRELSGKMWPGRPKSVLLASGSFRVLRSVRGIGYALYE